VGTLLAAALLDSRVERDGAIVDGGHKGVMAGTPIAPLLATLYLRDLDWEIVDRGATYARYSDDILVLVPPADLSETESLVRQRLAERGLAVNEDKSAVAAPGEPWDFLGFRHHAGTIGLAPLTARKLKARTTRLARSLLRWRERTSASADHTVRVFLRRTNVRLYGVPSERSDFSWATWFLPLLHSADGLEILDGFRAAGVPATSILMDPAAYDVWERYGVNVDQHGKPLGPRPARPVPHLTDAERVLYHRLISPDWTRHRRIEQERIPLSVALALVMAA
jgi:hypothetical protein